MTQQLLQLEYLAAPFHHIHKKDAEGMCVYVQLD